jgi:hypothetical protein
MGTGGFILMSTLVFPIFAGIARSPHSGMVYRNYNGQEQRRNGYVQRLTEINARKRSGALGAWQLVGDKIRLDSDPTDKIYVWGWYPGIYVRAQRLSSASKAFEGNMHIISAEVLAQRIQDLLTAFKKEPPEFIVDSRKRHFPWNRPPLELWPRIPDSKLRTLRYLPVNPQIREQYNRQYEDMLRKEIKDKEEALRFVAMGAFRDYVMTHYEIVHGRWESQHSLFKRKHL